MIEKDDFVFLQIGARYEGYASTIGRPVFFGKPEGYLVDAVKVGYEAHEMISSQLYEGKEAAELAREYTEFMEARGHREGLLYGPCHATGLMEGEPPWIETSVDYRLRENMTYCIDIFMGNNRTQRGFRIEDSVRVGRDRADSMTNYKKELFFL